MNYRCRKRREGQGKQPTN